MEKDNRYDNYTQLLEKVDDMFAQVVGRHPGKFNCQKGCYSCCQPGLTVSNVEARRIEDWLLEHPARLRRIQSRQDMLGDANFCDLLDVEGSCSVYEVRPLICRSHGMPISWKDEDLGSDREQRDVCPLNFTGFDLNELDQSDVMSIDRVNVLLSLINRAVDEESADERFALSDIISKLS
jgi:Fe-S-cluster containining protein